MLLSRDSTHFGCIGKATSLSVLSGTPCEEIESGNELRYGDSLPIRLCVRYSAFATYIIQRALCASETQRAVITIIHPAFATRSANKRGRVGVASLDQGREE
jgi:hypothetical protein